MYRGGIDFASVLRHMPCRTCEGAQLSALSLEILSSRDDRVEDFVLTGGTLHPMEFDCGNTVAPMRLLTFARVRTSAQGRSCGKGA
ncbi:hypothetical protein ASD02_00250 [Ensifer sp. Root1252]|nr:hypothetical protein ASD00_16885 [Ensifer sp. Root31]KQW62603.1 hypothetical protein ASD02_00250 [Ensifer sp. Root1252]KQW84719.1 hypothetical protein ASD03_02995 [Ensifer sp. Root127]KQY71563.1 hypothetical protein ASD52_07845 [Ensifer sp. Root142]KRC83423.1 hypothetical protein ASE32_00245 [Ensifer sp. Root231]KRC86672.1 hypothetical protein ASE47_17405 [Ensifer sp. Root258]OMQ44569.1 hypothetical protein BKP54_11530 [Ensifer sp. 1H6]PSS67158.1 hypothetical protein C6558_03875 [Ensifer 